ncbi:hypothetical protein SAMN05720468_104115 [Fibrobacter sp. UWEL]|nr:hypothetical protein SAMN05720468_104115 [Fibrobacter sp. UWEL]
MHFYSKKGVSLLTVLMFMLVATIAATATYKWLSSADRSSAGRLHMRQAEFAADAGIASARNWMTYHGSETGALIRQFLKDSQKRPISLDPMLNPLDKDNQQFKVWFVGADVETNPYTVKILSEGTSSDGSTFKKVSILNVNGLYRAKVPKMPKMSNYEEAVFAGATDGISLDVSSGVINGSATFNTAVDVDKRLIVAGNLNVNSSTRVNDLFVYGDLFTCTNFEVTNDTYVKGKIYFNGLHTYGGDIYAENGVDMSGTGAPAGAQCNTGSGGGITVAGNMTSNGDVITPRHNAGTKYTINGNLVINKGGVLNFPDIATYSGVMGAQPYEVKFLGNVYLSGGINNDGFHLRYKDAPNFVLGSTGKYVYSGTKIFRVSSSEGKVDATTDYVSYWDANDVKTITGHTLTYKSKGGNTVTGGEALASNTFCNKSNCAPTDNNGANFWKNSTFYSCSGTETVSGTNVGTNCNVARNEVFFQVNGNYVASIDTNGWGANSMSDLQESIDESSSGNCVGPHVAEALQFNENLLTNAKMHSAEKKGACAGGDFEPQYSASFWETGNSIDRWSLLEKCYDEAKKAGELYNDEWLLIKFDGSDYQFQNTGSGVTLRKKYIIVFENAGTFNLPPTSSDASVMMYWKKGGVIQMTANSAFRNYFIYSLGDVEYNGGTGKGITGSLYLADCHKVKAVNTIVSDFNSTLASALSEASVLCEYDGTKKCTKSSSGSGSSGPADTFTDADFDSYIISVAPQLLLTTKSEYKSREGEFNVNNTSTINPSILIMPRVLYLPRLPSGRLSDYYDVLNLNGATETKIASNVSCTPDGLPTVDKFADTLSKGVYTCTYSSSTYGDATFYALVDGNTEDVKLNFEKDFYEVSSEVTEVDVKLDIPGISNAQEVAIDIYMSAPPSGWTVTGLTPISTNSDGSAVYTLKVTPSDTKRKDVLFHVTKSGDMPGSLYFQLIPPYSGCKPGAVSITRVATSGSVNVIRQDISEYCNKYYANCQSDEGFGNKYYSAINAPNCDEFLTKDGVTDVWAYAKGTNCTADATDPNTYWICSMYSSVTLKEKTGKSALVDKYCEVFIPQLDNQFDPTQDNETGYVYGSIVRKTKALTVTLSNTDNSGTGILLKMNASGGDEPDPDAEVKECRGSGSVCQFLVYPGYKYFLIPEAKGTDNFSYFKCTGKDCTEENAVNVGRYPILISDNNSFYVAFNDKDTHCFYEDFTPTEGKEDFTSFCGNGATRCIDTCAVSQASGSSCVVTKGKQAESGNETADWVMVYNNRPATCANWVKTDECLEYYTVWPLENTCKRKKEYCASSSKVNGSTQLAPQISNNYLHANTAAYENPAVSNSTQAVVLSTRDAGFNGTMTSYFTTDANPRHNSGFIFRSNDDASEYYQLSIYGNASLLGTIGRVSNLLYAELCLVHGQGTRDNTKDICVEKQLETSSYSIGSSIIISENTSMTLILKVKGAKVDVNLGLDRVFLKDGERGISFDLANEFGGKTLADDLHNRVGMKMYNSSFRVFDISWMSDTYSGMCYAAPKLLCSFKANYLGGNVPANSDVTPWVAYSSFVESDSKYEGCDLKYYYNGCDLAQNYTSFTWNDWSGWYQYFACGYYSNDGSYWDVGSTLKDKYYNFTEEGPHGFAFTPVATNYNPNPFPGIKKDAKVKMECPSGTTPPSSMLDTKTCGEFLVGELKFCSENYDFRKNASGAMYCEANEDCNILVTGAGLADGETSVNLRDAFVSLEFNNSSAADISVSLVDNSGRTSSIRNTDGSSITITVEDVANTDLFDPQTITAIRVRGTQGFYVTSAISSCPYALGVTGCTVTYNGSSWSVSVSAANATSCDITPSDGLDHLGTSAKKTDVVCSEEGNSYTFEDGSLFENVSEEGKFYFEVVAKDGEKTSDPRRCASEVIQPLTVSCKALTQNTVEPGMGVPSFGFTLGNCGQLSSGKCPYEVSLDGVAASGSAANDASATRATAPFDGLNTPGSKYEAGSTHTWTVTTLGGGSCSQTFTVESNDAHASAVCSLADDKKSFSAQVTPDNHTWSAYVKVLDAQGGTYMNEVGRVNKQPASESSFRADWTDALPSGYTVAFVLNGETQSNCTFTVGSSTTTEPEKTPDLDNPTEQTPSSGTICMVANLNSNTHARVDDDIPYGSYTLKHNCGENANWWIYCTKGKTMTVNGTEIECTGSKEEGANTNKLQDRYSGFKSPKTGSTFTVPAGVIIYSMSCDKVSGIGPAAGGAAPEGCTDSGLLTGSGSTTPTTPSTYNTTCNFANSSHNWGDGGQFKFKTTCKGCAYTIKSPSGETKASGTTQNSADQENQVYVSTMIEKGKYSVFLEGETAAACSADPNFPEMTVTYCTPEKTTLAPGATTKFKANITNCNSNACTWYLKKNGSTIAHNSYGNYIEPQITGPGTYSLHLLDEGADAVCSVDVLETSPAETCKMDNSSRSYGEKSKFQVEHMSVASGTSWELFDPNGNSLQSGSFNNNYNYSWFETGEFFAKVSGSYKLEVDGKEACTANLTVAQPSVSNCSLESSTLTVGSNTKFKFNLNNCKNNQCSYELKLGDDVATAKENESDGYKEVQVTAVQSGTYKLWLNGVETSCSANITVTGEYADPGTYDYCINENNSNKTVEGKFKDGEFTFNFCKSCAKIQVHANTTGGSFEHYYKVSNIDGFDDLTCGYHERSFSTLSTSVKLKVGKNCLVTKVYVWDCK